MNAREAARLYISKGWQVVPLAPKSKAVVDTNWLKIVFTPEQFDPDDNIGIRSVGGLVDIDCDASEVTACARDFLPKTGAVYGRRSKPLSHWLYHSAFDKIIAYKDQGATDQKKSTLIEIRVNHQSMAPPSVHPDGEAVEWVGELGDAAHVDADVLHRAVRLTATCAMVSRYYNQPGARHDWGMALAGTFRRLGITEPEAEKVITCAARWAGDGKLDDRLLEVRTTYARPDEDPLAGTKALREAMPQDGKAFLTSLSRIWGSASGAFILDDKGNKILANNQENIARALKKLEVTLSYDDFAKRTIVQYKSFNGTLEDSILNHVWLTIDRTYHFRPTIDFFKAVVEDISLNNTFHPVKDYLSKLEWDHVPRIDTWLHQSGKAADTVYTRAVSAMVLIAAVRRVRKPGCKFDELMVLEGTQGHLKSTALRALCPSDDWFSDDLPLNIDAKQVIERTTGKWIIEAAELSGMHRSQVESLKAILSRQVDGPVRMAYARTPVERSRQFIVIGTTNSHSYLKDATGNRRFWPIRVEKFDIKWIDANRDQLWAEAAAREAGGESIRLHPNLYGDAAIQQERRRIEDPWETELSTQFTADKNWRLTVDTIWAIIGIPLAARDERSQERMTNVMQRLGFVRRTVKEKGVAVKGWARDAVEQKLPETE